MTSGLGRPVTSASWPPGSRLPWPLQIPLFLAGPRWQSVWARRYGDRFTVRLGPFGNYIYLADPGDIRGVFHSDDTVLHAGQANAAMLGAVLGPSSLLVLDEHEHRRRRKMMAASLQRPAVERLVPRMEEIAGAAVGRWPEGRTFPALPRMRAITLEVILQAAIGVTDPARLGALRRALLVLSDIPLWQMAQFAVPSLRAHRPWRSFWDGWTVADRLLRDEVRRAVGDPDLERRPDVLAVLARARDEDGSAMTEDELVDQLRTLLLAGHETTATALAWTLERLVRHRDVLEQATGAARSGNLDYLDAVVAETLRCRPVIADVARVVVSGYRLGDHTVPPGTFLNPAIALVHRSADAYPRPDRFDPQRFVGRRPDPSVWLPFGGGSRRCLGASLATTEMRVVLAAVLRRTDLAWTSQRGERPRIRHVTLVPHRGARILVNARTGR